jgi:hypothetical protein
VETARISASELAEADPEECQPPRGLTLYRLASDAAWYRIGPRGKIFAISRKIKKANSKLLNEVIQEAHIGSVDRKKQGVKISCNFLFNLSFPETGISYLSRKIPQISKLISVATDANNSEKFQSR